MTRLQKVRKEKRKRKKRLRLEGAICGLAKEFDWSSGRYQGWHWCFHIFWGISGGLRLAGFPRTWSEFIGHISRAVLAVDCLASCLVAVCVGTGRSAMLLIILLVSISHHVVLLGGRVLNTRQHFWIYSPDSNVVAKSVTSCWAQHPSNITSVERSFQSLVIQNLVCVRVIRKFG